MRKLAFILVLVAVIATTIPSMAKDTVLGSGTLVGTIASFEMGDYGHLTITDAQKKAHSYFVLTASGTLQSIVDHPEKYKGRRVKVWWQTVRHKVPEAGGVENLDTVVKAELQ